MKELSREHRALTSFQTASARVADMVRDEENIMFTRAYGAFEDAVGCFIQSELHFRQADRCAVLKIRPGSQKETTALARKLNAKGIDMLAVSQAMMAEFSKGLPADPPADPKFKARLTEFQADAREILVDLEMKASDIRELDGALSEVIAAVGAAKSSKDIAAFMTSKIEQLSKTRASPGRGAETNIAVWKLVAAAALLCVGAWLVYKCFYSRWRCSKKELGIYNSILSVAIICFAACE